MVASIVAAQAQRAWTRWTLTAFDACPTAQAPPIEQRSPTCQQSFARFVKLCRLPIAHQVAEDFTGMQGHEAFEGLWQRPPPICQAAPQAPAAKPWLAAGQLGSPAVTLAEEPQRPAGGKGAGREVACVAISSLRAAAPPMPGLECWHSGFTYAVCCSSGAEKASVLFSPLWTLGSAGANVPQPFKRYCPKVSPTMGL